MEAILGNRLRKLLGSSIIILVLAGIGYLVWARALRPLSQVDKVILIKNETLGTTICGVYLAEDPKEGWGTNWLESPIEPGASWATVRLPRTYRPKTFQARAEDCQGAAVEERTITLKTIYVPPDGLEPSEVRHDSDRVRKDQAQWIIEQP